MQLLNFERSEINPLRTSLDHVDEFLLEEAAAASIFCCWWYDHCQEQAKHDEDAKRNVCPMIVVCELGSVNIIYKYRRI